MNEEPSKNVFLPFYRGILPCCGNEMICEVAGKYPEAMERVSCSHCKASYNAKFFLNEDGVMALELRLIQSKD